MVFRREVLANEINVGDQKFENFTEFAYLGTLLTWDNDCTKIIKTKISKAKGVVAGFSNTWKRDQISHKSKLNIIKAFVFSTAFYACDTWTIKPR